MGRDRDRDLFHDEVGGGLVRLEDGAHCLWKGGHLELLSRVKVMSWSNRDEELFGCLNDAGWEPSCCP